MPEIARSIWIDAPPEVVFEYFVDAEKMVLCKQAGLYFDMQAPNGVIEVCDWITLEGNHIVAVYSFCDA